MRPRSHPEPGLLDRFLRGTAPLGEKHAVVRHLLAGCPECMAVTRRVWDLAASPAIQEKSCP